MFVLKAWNIHTGDEFTLDGPKGLVHAMVTSNDTLFAGAQVSTCPVTQLIFSDRSQ